MERGCTGDDEGFGKECNMGIGQFKKGKTIVGCKWVFTVKFKTDGSIDQ